MYGRLLKPFAVANSLAVALSCIVAIPTLSHAQARCVVTGKVVDAQSGDPLENANVFLSSTLMGTTTGSDGTYRLVNIPPGVFQLVGSRVGHKLESIPLRIMQAETLRIDLHLMPLMLQSEEVEVSAQEPKEWKRLLALFTRAFLGKTPNAHECTILNPEVLELHMIAGTNRLRASTDSVLRVQNQALGYLLSIRIHTFEWDVDEDHGQYLLYPRFEEIPARDEVERTNWQKNRIECYRGSLKHFLSALVGGTLVHEHFDVHWGKLTSLRWGTASSLSASDCSLVPMFGQPVWKLTFSDWLRVDFREDGRRVTAYITLSSDAAYVDGAGNLVDPLVLDIAGDWTSSRVADLLPLFEREYSHE